MFWEDVAENDAALIEQAVVRAETEVVAGDVGAAAFRTVSTHKVLH